MNPISVQARNHKPYSVICSNKSQIIFPWNSIAKTYRVISCSNLVWILPIRGEAESNENIFAMLRQSARLWLPMRWSVLLLKINQKLQQLLTLLLLTVLVFIRLSFISQVWDIVRYAHTHEHTYKLNRLTTQSNSVAHWHFISKNRKRLTASCVWESSHLH